MRVIHFGGSMRRALFVALLLCVVAVAPSYAQGMHGDSREAQGTLSVVGAKLGSHINDGLLIPVPKTQFRPVDKIYIVIETDVQGGGAVPGTLGVAWTYGSGSGVQSVYDESRDVLFDGPGRTSFEISKPDGWPVGGYQAEVFLNGEPVRKLVFNVR